MDEKWITKNIDDKDIPSIATITHESEFYKAYIKWDGTVEFSILDGIDSDENARDEQKINIPDLSQFIEVLQK